ncbi:MAG: signal peptidase II [Rhizobiaceae bacterium]|nr:signal peptidase II [Rhizobiaceae bacterium]
MSRAFWTILIVALVLADQLSKWLVENYLPFEQQVGLLPFFSLYRTYNYGVAFSMFADFGRWPLVILTAAIIAFVFWLWRSLQPGRILSALGYALVIGGAIGNLIDRAILGYVVDMLFFHIDPLNFRFAVFNLADTFITIGAGAIILDEINLWLRSRRQEKEPEQ